ncbi:nadph oxidase [Holotrichia oblita]|uniref:Nadph oxidase n=1 Tax=Holotrichia oblita TaxID=644536 RepID=A0ACB9TNF4_HOLOL|nr:nadph oxidase [Holotrichia oblita]
MEFLATITTARPHTGFDKGSLERLEKLFKETVGTEKEIRKEDFTKIVNSKNPFFTKRVFDIFDRDCSGSISFQEFLDAMHQFSGKTPEDKIKFLFRVYDLDGDGLIQRKELQDVMTACMHENGMKFSPDQIEDLTSAMIEDAGTNNKDAITYEALKNQLEKHGGLLENLSISIDRWLLPAKPKPPATIMERIKQAVPYQVTKPYLKNNYEYVIFLSCVVIVNVSLFISRAVEYYYKGENNYVIFARACDVILKKNSLINVNDTEKCSANHTQTCTAVDFLFTTKPGFGGLIPGLAFPTGIVLIIILTVMFICSQPFVRRRGSFQVFYWTHTLYIPFWILLILHCKNFWKWFILPGTLFIVERLIRFSWIKSGRGKSYITSGVLLSSKVVNLQIKRPTHFDFHPGDYIFANIPAIAKYEWHPFTISSAPEQEDSIWLHIRAVGEWTNKLYEYFREEQEKLETQALLAENPHATIIPPAEPQSPIKRFQATVRRTFSKKDDTAKPVQLIGFNHKGLNYENRVNASASDGELNNAASCSTVSEEKKTFSDDNLERRAEEGRMFPLVELPKGATVNYPIGKPLEVDFFWINRNQESFEWFISLLSKLEIEQAELGGAMERFLDMHMYITSALQKSDMKAVGLQLALDLLHQKEKRDLITGLKTRTNAGRPNWDKVFNQISDSGYANKTYLMTPLLNPQTPAQQLYNESHIRTRNPIERLFGVLKRRFPILAYGCRLKVDTFLTIIVATSVLHNIALDAADYTAPPLPEELEEHVLNDMILNGDIRNVQNDPGEDIAAVSRTELINNYFAQRL